MSLYLLDTTVLIDFTRGRRDIEEVLRELRRERHMLGTSPVNLAEFYSGVAPGANARWDAFVEGLHLWEISASVAVLAGTFRREMRTRGVQVHTPDALIAAVAFREGAAIITDNVRDFPMPGVPAIRPSDLASH